MIKTNSAIELEKAKLNLETSRIAWSELLRFFAGGYAIYVDNHLDLLEVAAQLAVDNKTQVEAWLNNQQIGLVSDVTAKTWLAEYREVWAVVVKPWVLVQEG